MANFLVISDRQSHYMIQKREDKQALLALLLETNHSCVHPLNHNYAKPDWTDNGLLNWGLRNGIITQYEYNHSI